jgi:signal transduction histidine kinase
MKRVGYQGSYVIGFIMIAVVALRAMVSFQGRQALSQLILLLAVYAVLYAAEPWLTKRFEAYRYLYFPVQALLAIAMTNLRPFTDISSLVYVPLWVQAWRRFERPAATLWLIFYALLLSATLLLGMGWPEGLALVLLFLGIGVFLISYDFLYSQTQANEAESQRLLADLQSAHAKLQEYAAQAEELAAVRERNRLARELHDSVNQAIFSITLTSQAARLLLERDPARVPEQIDRLQTMTGQALAQLRSLIAQLRPPQTPIYLFPR